MSEENKKIQELMCKIENLEKEKNKKMLAAMYIICGVSLAFYMLTLYIITTYIVWETIQIAFGLLSTVIFVISCFIALKFEADSGYYKCNKCGHSFVGKYNKVLAAMHIGTTRYLKCPNCNKRSWAKKVMTK